MRPLFASLACLSVLASCGPAVAPAPDPWQTDSALVTNMGSEPETISLPRVSVDGRIYTYTLRDGLTYSDGAPLVAQRFVDAFVRLCDPGVAGEYAFLAYPIAGCAAWNQMDWKRTRAADLAAARSAIGVRATDDHTVEFTLAEPFAAFPQATAMPAGAPVRVEDVTPVAYPWGTSLELTRFVGNGPFVLAEWRHNDRMIFERNQRYRLPVRLKTWTKLMISEPAVARGAYDHGELDALGVEPRDRSDRDVLLARSDLVRTLGTCASYVGFNVTRPPFDDPNVRMAFAKSIDKDSFAQDLGVAAHVAPSFVTHELPGHAHGDRAQDYDPASARRLLAASKYGAPVDGKIGGLELRFTFAVPGTNVRSPTRERIQWAIAQWSANLGVAVRLDPVDTTTSLSLIKRPEQLPMLRWMGWCAGTTWVATWCSSGTPEQVRRPWWRPCWPPPVRSAGPAR